MAKKLTLEDLKVQSFVTALTDAEAQLIVGGDSTPDGCASTVGCPTRTYRSQCCIPTSDLTDLGCACSANYTDICSICSTNTTSVCVQTNTGCGGC